MNRNGAEKLRFTIGIYAMMLVAKVLSHRDENDKSDKGEKQS